MLVENINKILAYLVLFGQILLILGILLYIIPSTRNALKSFLGQYGMKLAFGVAMVAMFGSLFYSEIAHYEPCKLCWYQRIFMYPQSFLLALAIYRKEKAVIDYSLLLLGLGTIVSLYHNYIFYRSVVSLFCSVDNAGSCISRYDLELSFMSLPLMALTAFLLIGFLLFICKKDLK